MGIAKSRNAIQCIFTIWKYIARCKYTTNTHTKTAVHISNTINGIANIEKPVTFICYLRNNHSSIQQSIGQNVTGIAVVN